MEDKLELHIPQRGRWKARRSSDCWESKPGAHPGADHGLQAQTERTRAVYFAVTTDMGGRTSQQGVHRVGAEGSKLSDAGKGH